MRTSSHQHFRRAGVIFLSSCLVAIIVFSGASLTPLHTILLSVDQAEAAGQYAPTGPLAPLVGTPYYKKYAGSNPNECWRPQGLCWEKACTMGSAGEQALSKLGEQLGQQLMQQLMQMMQGGGGGGGGGGSGSGGAGDPNAYNYSQDAALNDLYNNLGQYGASSSNLYDFFGPSDPNDSGNGSIDDFDPDGDNSGNGDGTNNPTNYFCPGGDCSFIKDFQNPDAVGSDTPNPNGPAKPTAPGASAGAGAVDNFSWSAGANGTYSDGSPIGTFVQLLTPGDPDRVIIGDLATMLGLGIPSNRLTPEQLAARQRAIEEAIRAGQDLVAIQGEDGETYYVGTDSYEAFSWQYPEANADYLLYISLIRLLRILPFPVIGAEPYLF